MTEDTVQRDIKEMKFKIHDIEKSTGLLLRARRQEVIDELMENCFGRSVERVMVFLEIDGILSISEIASRLKIKLPNISVTMKELEQNDLIELRDFVNGKKIYEKTSQVRRLRLEKYLRERFKTDLERSKMIVRDNAQQGTPVADSLPNP